MKIGLVLDDSIDSNDGVQQYVRTLGSWLEQQGHLVQYLAGQSKPAPKVHSLAKNIAVQFNGNRLTVPLPASSQTIQALLRRERYDVLHIQMPYSPMLAGKIIKLAPPSTAIAGTFHILPYGKLQTAANRLLGRYQRRSLEAFDEVCFVSPAALAFARQNYGISGKVISNMIDLSIWKNSINVKTGRMVFLGRLVPRKGCKELLLATAGLPASVRKRLEVIIAGDGPQRKMLENLAQSLKLKTSFRGYISEADKRKLLSSAELAVFPSLGGESFGIVLLEAMAAGAGVVIGGDNPGYKSVLGELPNAMMNFKTTAQASKQLAALLIDIPQRTVLHVAQQRLIHAYDVQLIGAKIENMYISAVAKHSKRRDNE